MPGRMDEAQRDLAAVPERGTEDIDLTSKGKAMAHARLIETETQRLMRRLLVIRDSLALDPVVQADLPTRIAAISGRLDDPCRTGLLAQQIADYAKALRANPDIVRFLRLRITDLETRPFDLTGNNRDLMEHLRAIAREKP